MIRPFTVLILALQLCLGEESSGISSKFAPTVQHEPLGLPPIVRNYNNLAYYELGKVLFFSNLLSTRPLSCASCHALSDGGATTLTSLKKIGGIVLSRSIPTIANQAFSGSYMWDGRARTLQEQAYLPLENNCEMDIDWEMSLRRVSELPEAKTLKVDKATVTASLGSYVESLLTGDSKFDRYFYGAKDVFSATERRGLEIFRGRAKCSSCHVINSDFAFFTDGMFHNLGIGFSDGAFSDPGRTQATNLQEHTGFFKTPTLRNISKTAPYMHDGSLATLQSVIEFYNRGGDNTPSKDRRLVSIDLNSGEISDLLAFLQTLNSEIVSLPPEQEGKQNAGGNR